MGVAGSNPVVPTSYLEGSGLAHAPAPKAESEHDDIRNEIERHPAVEHRHDEDKPIVEPEEGQECDRVSEKGHPGEAAEPGEQAGKDCL